MRGAKIPNLVVPPELEGPFRQFADSVADELREIREKVAKVDFPQQTAGTAAAPRIMRDSGDGFVDISPAVFHLGTLAWDGDDTNSRLIAVTDDRAGASFTPDFVIAVANTNRASNETGPRFAWYLCGAYGSIHESGAVEAARAETGTGGGDIWQGISGTNLLLGTNGAANWGFNAAGISYKAVCLAFGT